PFAAAPAPAPAPVNPFAAAPAPAPAPVNPFAAPAPAPVNPFAAPAPGDGPFRSPAVAAPAPQAPVPAAAPPVGVQPLTALRPLTTLVALAATTFACAVLYNMYIVATLEPATRFSEISALTRSVNSAERFYLIALGAVVLTFAPWLYVASRNAERLCADKLRFTPSVASTAFLMPVLNLVMTSNALDDIWRHSAEKPQPSSTLIRVFGRIMLYSALARAAVLVIGGGKPAALNNAFPYILGIGDPVHVLYGAGPSARGFLILMCLVSLALPVMATMACLKIERSQLEAHRRLRAAVI
ncbi:MAG: DUF4328 domain-containing protein, partial [Myxococcales bacterium]|nr:DUF4328 domain-containing protein [Myxococcales bacterium]